MATIVQEKNGRWRARVRRRGAPSQSRAFTRYGDAAAWARMVESNIERGTWHPEDAGADMTLADAMDRYVKDVATRHRGANVEGYTLGVMRDDAIAKLQLRAVDSAAVARFRDRMVKAGYAVSTINRRLGLLASVFSVARGEWGMPNLQAPTIGLRLGDERGRDRRTSDEELAAWASASRSPYLRPYLILAVETAMRRSEICNMEWADVDIAARTVHLEMTKNGERRDVPLSSRAVECLRELKARGPARGLVLGCKPAGISHNARHALKRARIAYEGKCHSDGVEPDDRWLQDLHLHDVRHEACSRLASKFALHELMAITGHRTTAMLQRYYHPRASDLARRLP